MSGKFITFEGPEGSGKSTHALKVVDQLRRHGIKVLHTREPGGTPLGESIRNLLQHDSAGETPVNLAEVLLFCASRAQLVQSVIRPALQNGTWVVCDRFTDSTIAYQGFGRGLDLNMLHALNDFATNGLKPDLTMLLDVPTEIGMQRINQRSAATSNVIDRIENEAFDFHCRLRNGFLALAENEPNRFRVINTAADVTEVEHKIWQAIKTWYDFDC